MKQFFLFLMTLLPMAASADDNGFCGDNTTYSFVESTGTLTISGSGDMYGYRAENSWYYLDKGDTPWKSYQEKIINVIIEPNVTSIGRGAFWGCSNMEKVTIPNTIKEMKSCAFKD